MGDVHAIPNERGGMRTKSTESTGSEGVRALWFALPFVVLLVVELLIVL